MAGTTRADGAYEYSIGQKCATEGLGMTLVIYFGESILANELLARTKGHEMGWVWVALGFGMSFGIPIAIFNYAYAKLNPAMLLAHWVYLDMSAQEFFALAACECLGGFIGAVLVWLHYLPHFKTIPEPPPATARDALLRPRDYVGVGGLRIAGYNTDQHTLKSAGGDGGGRGGMFSDAAYYLRNNYHKPTALNILGERDQVDPDGRLRRRSVQVADLHRRLDHVPPGDLAAPDFPRPTPGAGRTPGSDGPETLSGSRREASPKAAPAAGSGANGGAHVAGTGCGSCSDTALSRDDVAYAAALIADQNAKLSIFATRPAIYSPVFNFLAEFMATTALIAGALWIDERGKQIYPSADGLWPTLNGLYIGFFIFVFVLGLGGPTGVAANIARDTAPRFAHWLLPIPNKGPSEWYYAWIPATASLLGGLVGGGLYTLVNKINKSNVTAPEGFFGI